MQLEDKKFIQHKIQYTVAQCRELVGRKDQMNRNLKTDGVIWYLCYYVSTTVLSLYDLVPKGAHARGYALQLKIKHC